MVNGTSSIGRAMYKPHPIADGNPYRNGSNLMPDVRLLMSLETFEGLYVEAGLADRAESSHEFGYYSHRALARLTLGSYLELL